MLTWQWLQQQLQAVLLAKHQAADAAACNLLLGACTVYDRSSAVWVGSGCAPSSDHSVLLCCTVGEPGTTRIDAMCL
jgi:hypothetical protein